MLISYDFDEIIQSAYNMVQSGDWHNAEHQFLLASVLIGLDLDQKHFIRSASICIRNHDAVKLESLYHELKNEERSQKLGLHLKDWFLHIRPDLFKMFISWTIGLWLLLILLALIFYRQLKFSDSFLLLTISLLSVLAAGVLMFIFQLNKRDFWKDIGLLVFTSILIPLIINVIRYFMDHH